MKIVFVCRAYVTQRPGGMLHVLQDRAEELVRRGHEVHVLTTSLHAKQRVPDQLEDLHGVAVHHLLSLTQVYSDGFNAKCVKTIKALRPDMLHLESIPPGPTAWWLECRDAVAGPVGCTLHGFGLGALLTAWNLYRDGVRGTFGGFEAMAQQVAQLENFDRVIAISAHEQMLLRQYYGIPAVRVYNPIHPAFFATELTAPEPQAPFLCAAVSGKAERNFALADAAIRLIPNAQLHVVQAATREQMPAEYAKCRGVLLPTRYAQGFDLTLAEAAAVGRSALVTDTGSYAHEVATLGYTLVPPTIKVDEFAKIVAEWVPPEPQQLRTLAAQRFHPAVHCDRWLLAMKGSHDAEDNVLLYCP